MPSWRDDIIWSQGLHCGDWRVEPQYHGPADTPALSIMSQSQLSIMTSQPVLRGLGERIPLWVVLWLMSHPSPRFHGNQINHLCVIVLPINQRMKLAWHLILSRLIPYLAMLKKVRGLVWPMFHLRTWRRQCLWPPGHDGNILASLL